MAHSLPSPPTTREASPQNTFEHVSADDLVRRLDSLLEKYLEVLDEYTSWRERLSKTLSDGFFSLAQAQRTSNLGPGRRYGQDGYDSRMRAIRRIDITSSANQQGIMRDNALDQTSNDFNIYSYVPRADKIIDSGSSKPSKQEKSVNPKSAEIKDLLEESASIKAGEASKRLKPGPAYRDPVTWYGILVPPALRQSQRHFSTSVETEIPKLLSLESALQALESQIKAVRSDLSEQNTYSEDASEVSHRHR